MRHIGKRWRRDGRLEILGQTAVAVEPCEATLDDPSTRMNFEPDLVGHLPDDLYGDAGSVLEPLSGVGAVSECQFNKREAAPGRFQQWDSPVAILHTGRMHQQFQGPAISFHHGVPLATLDLLSSVVATRATGLSRLHALAVDHGRAGTGLAANALAVQHDQSVIDRLPHTRVSPGGEQP